MDTHSGALPRWAFYISVTMFLSFLTLPAFRGRPSPDHWLTALTSLVPSHSSRSPSSITKIKLSEAIGGQASFYRFPTNLELPSPIESDPKIQGVLEYSFDSKLQANMESLFRSYSPDYGAFVALDAKTGRVLSLVSYSRDDHQEGQNHANYALRATFPSASVFKVVTAAAAIQQKNYSPDTIVSYNGRNHTLYRNNILKQSNTRWTRYITFKQAFAQSINTVFGKIGAFAVGPAELRDYAGRFGFNHPIEADFPVQPGRAEIPEDPSDFWGLAESASGYTKENTMSPLQGALIASAIVNDGVMMEPYLVNSVYKQDGTLLYKVEPKVASVTVDPKTAGEIQDLMRETVSHGTSRRSFSGFFRGKFAQVDAGGKTGSLTGEDPPGKYDWFVGFAQFKGQKIAMAALTIHKKLWRVKSSFLARKAMETYFKDLASSAN